MDRDLPTVSSTRPPLMRWWLRVLIALLLVVAYAFLYFIVPKIEASWKTPGPNALDLRLMSSVNDVREIPTAGERLIVVAAVDHVLHFRIFDDHGKIVVNTDEKRLPEQAPRIEYLRKQLEYLWPPQTPTRSERNQVNATVAPIVGYTWLEPPGWLNALVQCSHFVFNYGFAILVVLTAYVLLRRWYSTLKARPRRFELGLGTVLGAVAIFAVTIAWLNAWLFAPFQPERNAAATLRQLGGKVVMVDQAPRWLRSYVGKNILNMEVATAVDLSHSRVTDADLVHFGAFQHCRQINLSDTQVSNAGLAYLVKMANFVSWLDLSRTRVTDVSVLFESGDWHQPSSLKLSGNRIARVGIAGVRWRRLHDLDLSETDADDGTLESLPDNLANVDLCGTNVSDDGLLFLLRMKWLVKLNLIDTKVTPAGVARVKSRWRFSPPPTILTGTRKKAGGTPKNASPQQPTSPLRGP